MSYQVTLDHFLSGPELEKLSSDLLPSLRALNDRYTPNIEPISQFPVSPIYVDCLRSSWMLDTSGERPKDAVAVAGLAFAFGILLCACTELRWAVARDNVAGSFLTLARIGHDEDLVSVPPFSYVEKRQEVQNVEVFRDFFDHVPAEVIGFRKPRNWLLDDGQA